MSADRPIEQRKPLSDWVPVPRWVLEKIAGEVAAQLNLKAWEIEGPRLCWPEDMKDAKRFQWLTKPRGFSGGNWPMTSHTDAYSWIDTGTKRTTRPTLREAIDEAMSEKGEGLS